MAEKLSELLEDIKQFVKMQVAGGFQSQEKIIQGAVDYLDDEANAETIREHAALFTAEAMSQHFLEQDSWPMFTDCDRLDAAFAELEKSGIISRQDFSCCGTCGSYEIGDEMLKSSEAGVLVRGYTFYHMQDTESAVDGYGLCFNYGSIDEPPESSVAIGHEIVSVLKRHDLNPQWSGSLLKRIQLPMDWKRRR